VEHASDPTKPVQPCRGDSKATCISVGSVQVVSEQEDDIEISQSIEVGIDGSLPEKCQIALFVSCQDCGFLDFNSLF